MTPKQKRKAIKNTIQVTLYALTYFFSLYFLVFFPGYEMLTLFLSVSLFAATVYFPDQILWQLEMKIRSESY